jgi:hypothetical protein
VHGAEGSERLVGQVLDRLGPGDVGWHTHDGEPIVLEAPDGGFERRLLEICQHHAHALLSQACGQREPNPARCACDDRDPTRELAHWLIMEAA